MMGAFIELYLTIISLPLLPFMDHDGIQIQIKYDHSGAEFLLDQFYLWFYWLVVTGAIFTCIYKKFNLGYYLSIFPQKNTKTV